MMFNALVVWLTAHKCTALVLDPSFKQALAAGRVHREVGFAPARLVDDLRYDIDALEQLGRFGPAGSGPRAGGDTGMRSALFADPIDRPRDVGCFDAFAALWERLGMVREELMEGLDRELIENVEVHYVRYPEGGYFQPRRRLRSERRRPEPEERILHLLSERSRRARLDGARRRRAASPLGRRLLRDPAGRGVARPL